MKNVKASDGIDLTVQAHPGLREIGLQVRAVEDRLGERRGHVDVVELAAAERQQPGLRLLDDRDLDPRRQRQLAAGETLGDLGVRRVAGRRSRKAHVAERGVRLEDNALAAPPLREPIGPGSHRILHHATRAVALGRDDLPGHRRKGGRGEQVLERPVGIAELHLQRVAVERLQALDRRGVVEASGPSRLGEDRVESDEPVLEQVERVRAHLRIEDALDAVDVVLGGELALRVAERRMRREVDAASHLDRVRAAAVADQRQAVGRVGDEPGGTREVVVGVQRIEDRVAHPRRIGVVDRLRIEAVLGDGEGHAQRARDRALRAGGADECGGGDQQQRTQAA